MAIMCTSCRELAWCSFVSDGARGTHGAPAGGLSVEAPVRLGSDLLRQSLGILVSLRMRIRWVARVDPRVKPACDYLYHRGSLCDGWFVSAGVSVGGVSCSH